MKNVFDFVVETPKLGVSTRLLFLFLALSPVPCALSQVPQGFNYQAIAQTSAGAPIANTVIQVKVGILSDTLTPVVVWEELHSSVKTNMSGVFNLVIGKGTRQSGSATLFEDIDWSVSPMFLKTQIYYQGAWKYMGSAKLWSVPYAMVSGGMGGPVKKLSVEGETTSSEESLFEVKNKDGQTVFAVYNEGVRIYVSDGTKAVKSGFAVGGFGTDKAESTKYFFVGKDSVRIYLDTNPLTKGKKSGFAVGGYDMTKGIVQNYLDVSADSVRVYIDTDPDTKKVKGGFAVGGYDMTKAGGEEYLRVTRDSTRVYVNDSPSKALKGGFAVGGFDATKGTPATIFTSLTPQNYFIGHRSGIRNITGIHNSFVGYESGLANRSGRKNVFLGYRSGYSNDTASFNVFIGNETGYSNVNGRYNSFLGFQAGYNNISSFNSFVGYQSGRSTTTGASNVFIGYLAGYTNQTGSNNVAIGNRAGYNGTAVTSNVFLGDSAGYGNTSNYNVFLGKGTGKANTGQYNSFIGYQSGMKNTSGTSNVFLGYKSGYSNIGGTDPAGSYNVFIGNQAGSTNTTGAYNVFLGHQAGQSNSTASWNVFIGYQAGQKTTTSNYNTYVGYMAGNKNITGTSNVFFGTQAGADNLGSKNTYVGDAAGAGSYNGQNNVFLGSWAGTSNVNGSNNVHLGANAGRYHQGSSNIFIGNGTGYDNATPYDLGGTGNVLIGNNLGQNMSISNTLMIDNTSTTTPLIWGDFFNDKVVINGMLGVKKINPVREIDVTGNIGASGIIVAPTFMVGTNWFISDGGSKLNFCYGSCALSTPMEIQSSGNVNVNNDLVVDGTLSIGTGASLAPLHVESYLSSTCTYGYLNSSGNTGTSSGSNAYSIFAQRRVRAEEFNADSDARIKHVLNQSDSNEDLEILKSIQVTDFQYIDSIQKGNIVHKKIIAQQLREIYPNAVTETNGYIPSIYSKPIRSDYNAAGKQMFYTTSGDHGLRMGDKVKFIEAEGAWTSEVILVISSTVFVVASDIDRGNIFIYGKEVNDFLTVDYEAVAMLNISATQNLIERIESQEKQIETQTEMIERLEKMVEKMDGRGRRR